ncbi:MAG: ABC transporter ATP-binding protein [Verrucomicrobia bacterium]|nr:ABC transporter ATP-binding protein [Verrucomicrobiota bacterium]
MRDEPLLQVEKISKKYPVFEGLLRQNRGTVCALQDTSFTVNEGEIVGVIGESGCGKSTLARIVACLTPPTSGKVFFDGVEVTALSQKQLVPLRKEFQIVFQNPAESLNPRKSILDALCEVLSFHHIAEQKEHCDELLKQVGLNAHLLYRYPHELSLGQLSRVCLARALCTKPKLLVLDECVSSLDISVQAQVLNFLMDLRSHSKMGYLFISHDLSVVRHIADRVLVMYQGAVVEEGLTEEVFDDPTQAYTKQLLSAVL